MTTGRTFHSREMREWHAEIRGWNCSKSARQSKVCDTVLEVVARGEAADRQWMDILIDHDAAVLCRCNWCWVEGARRNNNVVEIKCINNNIGDISSCNK